MTRVKEESHLSARWKRPWLELGLVPDPVHQQQVMEAYREPHRAYHTLAHLEECLRLLDEAAGLAVQRAEVELALWFHDAIYDPLRADNELRSAQWADAALREAGAGPEVRERIGALILVTRHDARPESTDAALVSDIDLAILGAPVNRFDEYERQVRQEYAHLDDDSYRSGRMAVLHHFMGRPHIFRLPWFRARYEAPARANLQRSMRQLAPLGNHD